MPNNWKKFYEVRCDLKYSVIVYDRDLDTAKKLFTKKWNESWVSSIQLPPEYIGRKRLTYDEIYDYWGVAIHERELGKPYFE